MAWKKPSSSASLRSCVNPATTWKWRKDETTAMGSSIPFQQAARIGAYVVGKTLSGKKHYPLVLMLEPLFRCNLACAGCGKIDYPDEILNQRLSVQECLDAADECGAPIISIPGGEPLLHKEMPQIVAGLIKKKKYVTLCTNTLPMEKKMEQFTPSPYFQ